jgi:PAS domain S-box-containing protein
MRPQDLGIGRLFERIRDAAIVAEATTQRIVLWNSAAANIFGYSTSEALKLRVEALVPEHLKEQHRTGITRYAETGRGPYIDSDSDSLLELPAQRKGGRAIYVEMSLSPIGPVADTDSDEHFVLAIVRDITQRKQAEEEVRRLTMDLEKRVAERTGQLEAALARLEDRERGLRESEERYRSFIEQSTEGIWRFELESPVPTDLSPDKQIECFYLHAYLAECNDAMARMYGFSRAEEIVGARLDDLLPSSVRENVEYLRSFVRSGYQLTDAESEEVDRHGHTKYFSNNLTGTIEDGALVRAWGVQRDITERKRVEEAQRFLAEASAVLSSSLDYRDTLTSVARLAVPYLADWCVVDVLEEDGSIDRLAVTHHDPEKATLTQRLQEHYPPTPRGASGVPQVLRTGRSEFVTSVPESLLLEEVALDAEHHKILLELGLKSYMIVPLVARGRTLGAITLVSAQSERRYGHGELGLAEELARRVAFAMDNARLYRARSQLVRTLQGGLLPPRLPDVPGVEVGLSYLPAGEIDVGGDFYDLFEARGNGEANSSGRSSSWGVVIGDVVGKGAGAAAELALARYTIRAATMHETRPSAVLADLNEVMLRQRREREDHKFCTAVYGRLETGEEATERGAKVIICRGGHVAPVLMGVNGSTRKVGRPGRAIGVFDHADLAEQEVFLSPGDALLLYTDGVVEARSPDGTFFGEERLAALLRSCAGLSAQAIAGRVESAVSDFQENNLRDDVAVLVLRIPNQEVAAHTMDHKRLLRLRG